MIEVQNSSNSETTIKKYKIAYKEWLKKDYILETLMVVGYFVGFYILLTVFFYKKDFYRILSSYILIVILILVIYRIVKPISNYYKTIKTLKNQYRSVEEIVLYIFTSERLDCPITTNNITINKYKYAEMKSIKYSKRNDAIIFMGKDKNFIVVLLEGYSDSEKTEIFSLIEKLKIVR
ncbi:MAG: hypothetical protein WCS22_01395 [Acholeplasmataceae bacterium]|jgi:hypothetical protein